MLYLVKRTEVDGNLVSVTIDLASGSEERYAVWSLTEAFRIAKSHARWESKSSQPPIIDTINITPLRSRSAAR